MSDPDALAKAAERCRLAQEGCRRSQLALDDAHLQLLECINRQEANLQVIDGLVGRLRELVAQLPSPEVQRLLAEAVALRAEAEVALGSVGHA